MRPLSADGALLAERDAGSARGCASLNKATETANRSIGDPDRLEPFLEGVLLLGAPV